MNKFRKLISKYQSEITNGSHFDYEDLEVVNDSAMYEKLTGRIDTTLPHLTV